MALQAAPRVPRLIRSNVCRTGFNLPVQQEFSEDTLHIWCWSKWEKEFQVHSEGCIGNLWTIMFLLVVICWAYSTWVRQFMMDHRHISNVNASIQVLHHGIIYLPSAEKWLLCSITYRGDLISIEITLLGFHCNFLTFLGTTVTWKR